MSIADKPLDECKSLPEHMKARLKKIGAKRFVRFCRGEKIPLEIYNDGIILHNEEIEKGTIYIFNVEKKDTVRDREKEITIKSHELWYLLNTDEALYHQKI